jgi:hypothetical protein
LVFVQTIRRDRGDAGEDLGQPSLRIDVVQPAGRDQRDHDSGSVGIAV